MYEQYTDKQIVEMFIPKLKKSVPELNWDEYLKRPDAFSIWNRLISVIYKSGYIRGQLGRSFIIGESKQTEHWVPATRDNIKAGSKVRYLNAEKHARHPEFYPLRGTIGEAVTACEGDTCVVRWPDDKTTWYVGWFDLEVLLCE